MPDFIDNQIKIFDNILKIYENDVKENLEHEAIDLKKRLKVVLDANSVTYNLESKNEVTPIKYYSFKHRIKEVSSLKEKFIRKNDGFNITFACKITSPNEVDNKKPDIINQLYRVADVIGIRIVTELRYDCKKVLSLLLALVDELEVKDIVLDRTDLGQQPQLMKNGFSIFKIKGIFRSKYSFELQIKSKIEEAWGDMDHAIFYKDYSVTPVKNATQVTMNNVGKLLEDIDQLLLGLRNSSGQYQESLEQLNNLKALNDEIYPLIKNKFGMGFEIGKIASFLTFIKEKLYAGMKHEPLSALDGSVLEYTITDDNLKQYASVRAKSFELVIIELAFVNWSKQNSIEVNQENYEDKLNFLLRLLSEHLYKVIEQENSAQAAEIENPENLFLKICQYSKYIKNHNIYLSEQLILKITKIEGNIEEFFQEKKEMLFSENYDFSNFSNTFKKAYVVHSLGYDYSNALDEIFENFKENEDQILLPLETIAYEFKEYQRKNERNLRADQRKGEVVKELIPTVMVAESIIHKIKEKVNGR